MALGTSKLELGTCNLARGTLKLTPETYLEHSGQFCWSEPEVPEVRVHVRVVSD